MNFHTPGSYASDSHYLFEQIFNNIDDILHKDAGSTRELYYTELSA